jgi:hypothetical protein
LGVDHWGESAEENSYDLWQAQLSRGKFAEALETASYVEKDIPKAAYVRYIATIPKLASGQRQTAELEILRLRQTNNIDAALWLGGLEGIYRGKLQSASEEWLEYARIKRPEKSETPWTTAGRVYLGLVRIALLAGKDEEASSFLKQVQGVRDEYLAEVGKYHARLGDGQAERILQELRARVARRETNQNLALLELVEGEIELEKGHFDRGFTLISSAAAYPWSYSYLSLQESLGNAALKSGNPQLAIQAFKAIVDRRGLAAARDCPDVWIMAHYYAGRSYEAAGDKFMALSYYNQFEQFWHDGDPTLPALIDVRTRISKLTQ